MTIGGSQIKPGMKVSDADRVPMGQVREVRQDAFLVDRDLEPPIELPLTAVYDINGDEITLNIPARQLGDSSPPTRDLNAPFTHQRVRPGMEVFGSDGELVGRVRDLGSADFVVNRSIRRDVHVPFDVIQDVTADRVVIEIAASQVDHMDWPVS